MTTKEAIESRADKWDPASAPTAADLDAESLTERGNEHLRAAQPQLERQVGLADAKMQVAKLRSTVRFAQLRENTGLSTTARPVGQLFTNGQRRSTVLLWAASFAAFGVLVINSSWVPTLLAPLVFRSRARRLRSRCLTPQALSPLLQVAGC